MTTPLRFRIRNVFNEYSWQGNGRFKNFLVLVKLNIFGKFAFVLQECTSNSLPIKSTTIPPLARPRGTPRKTRTPTEERRYVCFPYCLIKIHNFVLYKYYNRNRQIDGGYWYYFESQFKVTIIYILLWASSFLSCFYTSVWFLDFCSFSFTITLSSSTGPHLLPLHHHFSVPSAWIQSSTSMTTAITLYCTSYFTTPIWITNHHWLNTKYLNRSSHLYHNYHHHNTLWQHNRKW